MATQRRTPMDEFDIPQYTPGAAQPATPAPAPSIGQTLRRGVENVTGAIRRTPGELAGELRGAARTASRVATGDMSLTDGAGRAIEAVGAATAPLAGVGQTVASVPRAAAGLRGAEASVTAARALPGRAVRGAIPSAGQALSGAGLAAVGALGLAQADMAQSMPRQGVTMLENGAAMPASALRPTRVNMLENGEMLPDSAMQRPGASTKMNYDYGPGSVQTYETPGVQRRSGPAGAVIKNPHGMSMEDRLRGLLTSMKGSPSMRRAAAESMIGERNNEFTAGENALNRDAEAANREMDIQSRANENFADRRLKADSFNTELRETRRQNDASNELEAERIVDGVGRRGAGRGTKNPAAEFADQIYKDVLRQTGDPEAALEAASRASVMSGDDPSATPYGRAGQTIEHDRVEMARRGVGDRWTKSNNPDFDSSSAMIAPRGWAERRVSRLPGGVDPTDVKLVDGSGQEDWATADAVPPGMSKEAFARHRQRQAKLREKENK